MRRLWIACVALVLLSGCVSHSSAAQEAAYKRAFVQQLVGYCANVDRQLATIDPEISTGSSSPAIGQIRQRSALASPPKCSAPPTRHPACCSSTTRRGNTGPLRRRCPAGKTSAYHTSAKSSRPHDADAPVLPRSDMACHLLKTVPRNRAAHSSPRRLFSLLGAGGRGMIRRSWFSMRLLRCWAARSGWPVACLARSMQRRRRSFTIRRSTRGTPARPCLSRCITR